MLEIRDLTVRAGNFRLTGIHLEVPSGSCAALMGRTGCGKSTLLEAVCGLRPVERGHIRFQGRDLTRLRPGERGIGLLPQDCALFSALTVRDNLAFGPRIHHWPVSDIENAVETLASQLGITHLLDRKPQGLSGGEARRVGLGRALALRPGLLCLDEPLSGLDSETHSEILTLLQSIVRLHAITTLFVTHNPEEAHALASVTLRLSG